MSERIPLLILGLGNVLLEDDGVGAAAVAQLLDRFDVPEGVRVFDGGTLGLALLPYVQSADTVILVDAVRADAAPGTLVRLDGDEVGPAVASRLSPHQVGVADLLDGARWLEQYPRRVVLWGLVPGSMDLAVGLSAPVHASLAVLVDRVVDEARCCGFVLRPLVRRKPDTTAAEIRLKPDATRVYEVDGTSTDVRVVDVARLAGMR
jgi:hydrogenase maturation protease